MGHPSGQLDVVGGQDDCVTGLRQLVENGDQPVLARVVEAPGRFVEEKDGRLRRQDDGERQGQPLPLREIPGMAVRSASRAGAGRAFSRWCPASKPDARSALRHSSATDSP